MIYLDVFESEELEDLLSQDLEVVRFPLNDYGMADIQWTVGVDEAGQACYQWENKDVTEILGNFEHVEEQLQKQAFNAAGSNTTNGLIVRGVVIPRSGQTLAMHHSKGKQDWFIVKRSYKFPYSRYRAWITAIRRAGIVVVEVGNMTCTARHIVQEYKQSINPKTTTLKKHYHPHVIATGQNPHIRGLMGLSIAYGLGLGEDRATKLIKQFGTLGAVLLAGPKEIVQVDGIGKGIAEKFKRLSE